MGSGRKRNNRPQKCLGDDPGRTSPRGSDDSDGDRVTVEELVIPFQEGGSGHEDKEYGIWTSRVGVAFGIAKG